MGHIRAERIVLVSKLTLAIDKILTLSNKKAGRLSVLVNELVSCDTHCFALFSLFIRFRFLYY